MNEKSTGGIGLQEAGSDIESLSTRPISFVPNRVWRTYHGGRSIDEWQGITPAQDGRFPEEWVASTVRATNVGRETVRDEGLSKVLLPSGQVVTLKELIDPDPVPYLGQPHIDTFGTSTALLVKLLDSCERLTLQVHPDQAFARQHFASPFGKTEAWYVLGQRSIDGEEPYVLLGFKPGVTASVWKDWFLRQDMTAMMNGLHRIPIEAGRVYLVPAGTPHAIGPGCFLIEIQEPTDYTFRVERTTPRGEPVPDHACHQGIGFDSMLDSFQYEPLALEQVYEKFAPVPVEKQSWPGGRLTSLIRNAATERFRMDRLVVDSDIAYAKPTCFVVCVVTEGRGRIEWETGSMIVVRGTTLCLPAACHSLKWTSEGAVPLTAILCYPPTGVDAREA